MAQNGNGAPKFVCYYRVITKRQRHSGLGLEAQKKAVMDYLNGGVWKIVGEFTEVETGKRSDNRPQLKKALDACRLHGATLVVAKLDRLSRNVHFLTGLMERQFRLRRRSAHDPADGTHQGVGGAARGRGDLEEDEGCAGGGGVGSKNSMEAKIPTIGNGHQSGADRPLQGQAGLEPQ